MSEAKISWLLCIGILVSKTDNVIHIIINNLITLFPIVLVPVPFPFSLPPSVQCERAIKPCSSTETFLYVCMSKPVVRFASMMNNSRQTKETILNNKVLLRDRKRSTARAVHPFWFLAAVGGGGGPLSWPCEGSPPRRT